MSFLVTGFVAVLLRAFTASYVVSTLKSYWPDIWAKLGKPEPSKFWLSREFTEFDGAILSRRFRHVGIENRDLLLQLELVFVCSILAISSVVGFLFSMVYAP